MFDSVIYDKVIRNCEYCKECEGERDKETTKL